MAVIAREMARTSPLRTFAAQSSRGMLFKRRVLPGRANLKAAYLHYFLAEDLRASTPGNQPRNFGQVRRTAKPQDTPVRSGYSGITGEATDWSRKGPCRSARTRGAI